MSHDEMTDLKGGEILGRARRGGGGERGGDNAAKSRAGREGECDDSSDNGAREEG